MYIIINDFISFSYKYFKEIIGYLIIIISYLLFKKILPTQINSLNIILGGIVNSNFSILDYVIFSMNICINFFIVTVLLNNDFYYGFYNIFLRINLKKWLLIKITSIFTILLSKNIILIILSLILNIILGINTFMGISLFFKILLFNYLMIFFFIIIISFNKQIITLSAPIFLIILLSSLNINILNINIIFITSILLIEFLIILFRERKLLKKFEKF